MDLNTAVELAKQDKNEGYEYLYNLVKDKSFYVAKKYMKNIDASEELLQDCFVEMMSKNKIASLSDNNSFVSWFNQIVANKAKDYLKKSETKNSFFSSFENDDDSNYIDTFEEVDINSLPEEAFLRKIEPEERKKLVDELMADLSDDQRYCIVAHYLQDISVKDIAKILNVSENTVKSRLFQGRKKIEKTGTEMKKRGVEFFGVVPFMLFLGLIKEEAFACEYAGSSFINLYSMAKSSMGKDMTSVNTSSTVLKSGLTIAGKTIGIKTIVASVGAIAVLAAGASIGLHGSAKDDEPTTEKYYIDFYGNGNYLEFESGYTDPLNPDTKEKQRTYATSYGGNNVTSFEESIKYHRYIAGYEENDIQHIYVKLFGDKYYVTSGNNYGDYVTVFEIRSDNTIGTESEKHDDIEKNIAANNYDFSDWVDITTFENVPMSKEDAWNYSMEHQEEWRGLLKASNEEIVLHNASEENEVELEVTQVETKTPEIMDDDTKDEEVKLTGKYRSVNEDYMFDLDFDSNKFATGDVFGKVILLGANSYNLEITGDTSNMEYSEPMTYGELLIDEDSITNDRFSYRILLEGQLLESGQMVKRVE